MFWIFQWSFWESVGTTLTTNTGIFPLKVREGGLPKISSHCLTVGPLETPKSFSKIRTEFSRGGFETEVPERFCRAFLGG